MLSYKDFCKLYAVSTNRVISLTSYVIYCKGYADAIKKGVKMLSYKDFCKLYAVSTNRVISLTSYVIYCKGYADTMKKYKGGQRCIRH